MQDNRGKRPLRWPGMPTRRSQMFESAVMVFPVIVAVVAFILVSLVITFRSCIGDP